MAIKEGLLSEYLLQKKGANILITSAQGKEILLTGFKHPQHLPSQQTYNQGSTYPMSNHNLANPQEVLGP